MNEALMIVIGSIFNFALVKYLLRKLLPIFEKNYIDIPNSRSIHKIPKPTGGAILVVLSSFLTYLLLIFTSNMIHIIKLEAIFNLWRILILSIPLSFLGFIDDLYEIKTNIKFATQIITAILFINFIDINFFTFGKGILYLVLYLGIVTFISGLINIVNFMDGIDGLICGIFSLTFIILSIKMNVFFLPLSLGFIAFLNKNWYPSKIFMGDAGSTFLGGIFAASILQSNSIQEAVSMLLLISPILMDSIFCIFRRIYCGQNIFKPHKLHLYQRLVQNGFSHDNVSIIYISGCFFTSIFYISNSFLMEIFSAILVFGIGIYLEKKYAKPFPNKYSKID